jgi:hypothetical protein
MRLFATASLSLLGIGSVMACTELPPTADSPILSVGCAINVSETEGAIANWELTVSPEPIEAGKPFSATLGGFAVFQESFLDDGQVFFSGGVDELDLVELNATVHVRSGATGDDVVLKPAAFPYVCDEDRTACDPANDVVDDPPRPPGLRANTDCEPVSPGNQCGRFIGLPISRDCGPGGICTDLGKTGPDSQCEDNGFCITGDLRIPLQEATGQYIAASTGRVLFGWADESTGATVKQDEPNKGTWILPEPLYSEPAGPVGFRVNIRGIGTAAECAMAVQCSDPVLGVDCANEQLASPTPSEALLSFPIQGAIL